ncbi:hypothetical protein PHYBLDRAFT_73685 [Phycomyces blakesleeanus NRRL 1555(-)]|uniref:Uncharacterized protein n=1 Tax=Phycomyces blakesleeanus (strain ATCC 8743b / DSM 1359 / FGSC 10004 / NBRC 33097 / NRRL 1555) TaxID=763407 RepID=A0A167JI44_PHYB8|nr:hypothetical protein PHYBLDRAFT_73685 [Phycomyces blakesleeanus NRRL 1555(-)]OAD66017.1 hypothetical protein PHYBLDRAFT_73685 [Phycomyces blakesleeanus NRRL 1555(-)]|eukprot:XP_018284057.1 hypothetical protein PHYBLDRAFT_73685 [Phycomyces blakesleeanus NRRL 1555(-)]
MPLKRTNKKAEDSNRKLQIKQYKIPGFEEEKKPKKTHGFWNETKELKGAHKKAWNDIVKSVNNVTPGETELSYETCRRKMLRLVDIYKGAFEEKTVVGTSSTNKNRPEIEKAVSRVLDKHEAFNISGRQQEIGRQELKLGLEGHLQSITLGAPGRITNLKQVYRDFVRNNNADMQEEFPTESSAMSAARPVSRACPASIEDGEGENADEEHPKVGYEASESQVARQAEAMGVLKQILNNMCDIEEKLKKAKKK